MSRHAKSLWGPGARADITGRRVLVVEPSGNLWGSERALLDLSEGLTQSGCHLGLLCPPETAILSLAESKFAVVYPNFVANLHRKTRWSWAFALMQLLRAIRQFKPDLIYVNQAGVTKLALTAARIADLSIVTHTRLREDVDYLLPMLQHARVHHVFCVSDFIRDCFESKTGNGCMNGITTLLDCYKLTECEPAIRNGNQNRLICVGRFEANKGQDILIDAFKGVCEQMPLLHLLLLGLVNQDEFTHRLRADTERLELGDQVSMIGFSDDIWAYLRSADFLVCPSHVEALGRVVFEAWDAGIVPIAYAGSGGPAETIAAANAGVLYDHQDPSCIADAILAAYELSQTARHEMVQRGRGWIRENLAPNATGKKVSAVFDSVVSGKEQK